MALADLDTIEPLLVCPRCRSPLHPAEDGIRCTSSTCALAAAAFPVHDGRPVLVDFDDSILGREELLGADSGIRPKTGNRWSIDRVPRWLRSCWKPPNDAAARGMDTLVALSGGAPTVLVVGGGTIGNGTERLYDDDQIVTVAFDIHGGPVTQIVADAHQIPLADASVDAVVVQAVLEHVLDPARVVAEIRRVLRPAGLVYAETPFLQQVHAGPYDFTRFTSSGHRYLFRGFDELDAGVVAGPGTQLLWSLDHLVRGLLRSELAGKLARGLLFGLRYLDRLVPARYAMDNASAYFFLGRRSEHDLTPHQIIGYYRGAQRTSR